MLYIRFSWSVGVAGGRKEVSTHTDTMVQFPSASPQDAARIYTRVWHTHTHTQRHKETPNRESTHDAFIDFTTVDFSYEKKKTKQKTVCRFGSPAELVLQFPTKWRLYLPKDRAIYGKQVVESCFFLQRLHTLSCLPYARICDNFYSPWLYLLKHFHMWQTKI